MSDDINIQQFGYTEMYEWVEEPDSDNRFCKFVTFSKEDPEKIELYGKSAADKVLGVTTINAVETSDDPDEWDGRYLVTETGDVLLKKERLAVGGKEYDENLEMAYIKTFPWEHLIRIENEKYDSTKDYVKRSNRLEWIRICLMGKAIVYDNGECKAGDYCTPYIGKIKTKKGTAIPASKDAVNKFYVLKRLTANTILILYK